MRDGNSLANRPCKEAYGFIDNESKIIVHCVWVNCFYNINFSTIIRTSSTLFPHHFHFAIPLTLANVDPECNFELINNTV